MHEERLGRLPVIEDGRLVGIVARGDILRSIVASPGE
jgi:CBS domain-containing protein